jgi:tripartite-type tricarboxylate transporter receptor subunit TctC
VNFRKKNLGVADMRNFKKTTGVLLTLLAACTATPAQDFYAGKIITIIVGSDAGGYYDTYAGFFARHFPRLIPGKSSIVFQNVPSGLTRTQAACGHNANWLCG